MFNSFALLIYKTWTKITKLYGSEKLNKCVKIWQPEIINAQLRLVTVSGSLGGGWDKILPKLMQCLKWNFKIHHMISTKHDLCNQTKPRLNYRSYICHIIDFEHSQSRSNIVKQLETESYGDSNKFVSISHCQSLTIFTLNARIYNIYQSGSMPMLVMVYLFTKYF